MHGQPPSGPQYPQQPPPGQPPRKRKAWPWVLLGCGGAALLVLILGVACAAAMFSGTDSGEGEPAEESAGESVGVGEPGTAGQWQVTVNGIETAATYGDEFSEEQAQGEFKIVDITVENTGDDSTTFDGSAVSLIDAEGNTYSSSTTLSDDSLFLEQINPGNEASGSVVVDVPEGTEITEVKVEDMFSFEDPLLIQVE